MPAADLTPSLGDRRLFPDLDAVAYLNHAAMSPPSLLVRQACQEVLDRYARFGAGAWVEGLAQRDRLRQKLATLIGAESTEIALVPNTSMGVIDIALSLPWRAGDRVVLFEGEFPTNVTPWQRAAELFGLELVFHSASRLRLDPDAALAELAGELARGVRLCAISAVQFQTGFRAPLERISELCQRHGTELFVDAIQAIGATPVDVRAAGIDYLAAGGHKWLMAPEGCGMLYVRSDRAASLRPAVASWLSHDQGTAFLSAGAGLLRHDLPLRRRADVFEVGVTGTIAFAGMEAAVGPLLTIGVDRIHAHLQGILDVLERELLARGFTSARGTAPEQRSGILSVTPPGGVDGADLWRALDERGVRCAYPDGYLRFSPHWPNGLDQIEGIVAAIDDALGR